MKRAVTLVLSFAYPVDSDEEAQDIASDLIDQLSPVLAQKAVALAFDDVIDLDPSLGDLSCK